MRHLGSMLAIVIGATLCFAPTAQADFGVEFFDTVYVDGAGSSISQAGAHPYAVRTRFDLNASSSGQLEGELKDFVSSQIVGLVGSPEATPRCSTAQFLERPGGEGHDAIESNCPDSTAVGVIAAALNTTPGSYTSGAAVYNLESPPGVAAKLGFVVASVRVTIEIGVRSKPPYDIVAKASGTPQVYPFLGSILTLWGNPASPVHDPLRGACAHIETTAAGEVKSRGNCPVGIPEKPLITLPRACGGPLETTYAAASWQEPGPFFPNGEPDLSDPRWKTGSVLTHDDSVPSNPMGMTGCGKLGFKPSIAAQPTSKAAQSPSGLDFSLQVDDEGLTSPNGLAHSDIRKAEVTLPEGFTTNPSIAEGLEVCTQAQLAAETAKSSPGAGCPQASKIGTVEVETPLLDEQVNGALFVAKPYENPFGSLLALYIVIKNPTLGIVVRQALEVRPDPVTGRLTTVAENLPQLPFSSFRLHFREGARSPLATPPTCGTHNVVAKLYPWAGGTPVTSSSAFQIISGPNSGPCPSGGLPPFRPDLLAGTLNNRAGSYSPFNLRLSRNDGEQELTRFSIKLPPGITGKLAGIPYCPDAAIEAAKHRTGTEEELNPSCPKVSEVGHTLAGAGVGPSPAYAPGKIYLAGPYNGSALSIAAITAAKVGPFDLGTVVIRQALKIDRNTAEVFIDATGSDPIPHIIDGIQVHARDIRAYVDRPDFVLNPTSCERTSTASTVLGSGLNFASDADDNPVAVSTPFQAADCASLPFNPKLSFRLIGGTKRGAHPRLRAVVRMKPGGANISYARVTLPRSAFLDQSHIGTVCTRVQYAQKACPKASIYGYARAVTPILDTPIEGPIYLRSSSNKLPDLVAAFQNGQIEFDLVGRIDSLKGRIRNTFDFVPDAPVSQAVFNFEGGNKGLIQNSTNLCKGKHRAIAEFEGHNGKVKDFRPVVKATKCGKKRNRQSKSRTS